MIWLILVPAAISLIADVVEQLSDDEDVKEVAKSVKVVSNAVASVALIESSKNALEDSKDLRNL